MTLQPPSPSGMTSWCTPIQQGSAGQCGELPSRLGSYRPAGSCPPPSTAGGRRCSCPCPTRRDTAADPRGTSRSRRPRPASSSSSSGCRAASATWRSRGSRWRRSDGRRDSPPCSRQAPAPCGRRRCSRWPGGTSSWPRGRCCRPALRPAASTAAQGRDAAGNHGGSTCCGTAASSARPSVLIGARAGAVESGGGAAQPPAACPCAAC